jgi:segregation and condensation protein A
MTTPAPYEVQLPVFEGPLDLLLDLIERAELDITKVALAEVTDQYLAYLRRAVDHHLADLAAFLVVAARLLQIKSEALLPRPPERAIGEEDPGEALARQLIAYKKYKQIAYHLAERSRRGLRTYLRLAPPPTIPPTLDLSGLTSADLRSALEAALTPEPGGEALESVVRAPLVNLRDQIRLILVSIRSRGRTSFQKLLRRVRSRLEIVVTFLAVLELVKQRRVAAQQEQIFSDIELVPSENWREDQDLEFELEFDK